MSEDKRGYKKGYFTQCMMILVVFILIGTTVFLYVSGTFNIIETIAMAMVWVIPIGGMYLMCYLCSRSRKKNPKPKGDQSAIFEIKRPKYKIYRVKYNMFGDEKKTKLMGYLEGNVVYNKSHKYIMGYFDDRGPHAIDFIRNERVVMQLRGDMLYSARTNQSIAQFDDLKVSTLRGREIVAYIELNESMDTADIMMETKRGPEKVGEIDGKTRGLNTARACAIYGFLFDFFA